MTYSKVTLKNLQAFLREKDYHPDIADRYFLKLVEELGELAEAIRKEKKAGVDAGVKETIAEEIYDVIYYCLIMANIYDVDIEKVALLKEKINKEKYNHKFDLEEFLQS